MKRQFFNDASVTPAAAKSQKAFAAAADAHAHHERMEAELARAMNRWQKSRAALKRAEKKADKLFSDK